MSSIDTAPISNLSRRRWIKVAALTGVGLTTAVAFWSVSKRAPLVVPYMLEFDRAEARTWSALAEAVLPTGQGFPDLEESGVLLRLDEEVYFVSEDAKSDIHAALQVLEYLPLIYGYFTRFSGLGTAERAHIIALAQGSRFDVPRAVSSSLRLMVQLFYFGSKPAWKPMGYDGPFARIEENLSEQRIHYARLRKERQA